MAPLVFLVLLFVGLALATYRDIKTREVPDTLNYGLMVVGVLGGVLIGLVTHSVSVVLEHIFGFLFGLVIGLVMYYGRQWGGGDAKLIMGVGAILGLSMTNLELPLFLVLLVLCGAFYGVMMTLYLALVKHRKVFLPAFRKFIRTPIAHRLRITLVVSVTLCLVATFFVPWDVKFLLFFVMAGLYLLTYSWIFMKVVEQSILLKTYPVGKLTEGDWVAQDVKVGKTVIVSAKSAGITLAQIAQLKKARVKEVLVKEGIAFVPGFLLAYVVLLVIKATVGVSALLGFLIP